MKQISKAQNEEFVAGVTELLKSFGATDGDYVLGKDYWAVETRYGKLQCHVQRKNERVYRIFMRFEEPERAGDVSGVNEYSGKWNMFVGSDFTAKQAIDIFKIRMAKVM
jgi:hypothetical protein